MFENGAELNTDLRVGDGGQSLLLQLVDGLLVLPQVELGADQDDGDLGAVVAQLRVPFGPHRNVRTSTTSPRAQKSRNFFVDFSY